VVQAADFGPDLYSIQKSSDGTQRLIQAFTADGQLLWQQTVLGPLTDNSVPDAFGGLLTTAVCDPANPSGVAAAINDEDGLTGASLWSIQLASGVGVCPSGVPKMAIRQDGAVVIAGPLQTANPLLVVDGQSGSVLLAPAIPPSTLINSSGQSSSCDCFTPVGQPMVDSDGSTYVEYEVRQLDSRGATSASSILWLLKIAPDGTTSTTQLSASNNANLFPGNIIPDGQGGVLATWTVDVPFGPPGPHLYQAADVFPGGGLNHYDLPMAPMQLMVDTNTGLPINPPLVLGENGTAFVSYGTNVTSFDLNSGAVNWNYQAAAQTAVSLVSYANGNGLAGKITNNGQDTILRFDFTGATTTDTWSATNLDHFLGDAFVGSLPASFALGYFRAQQVDPTPSLFPAPMQKGSNRAFSISVKLNFNADGNSPNKTSGDNLKFIKQTVQGVVECSESLGPINCSQQSPTPSDRWILNFEGNGRVYDDASKWTVAQSIDTVHFSGLYTNINNGLSPFNCTYPGNNDDGPSSDYLQQTPGQKSIFYIDGPGPTTHVSFSNPCNVGFQPVDSMTWWANFKVKFTNLPTNNSKTLYFYVKIVVNPGRQLDITKSIGKYGSLQ
jgi:hypothetical protein